MGWGFDRRTVPALEDREKKWVLEMFNTDLTPVSFFKARRDDLSFSATLNPKP